MPRLPEQRRASPFPQAVIVHEAERHHAVLEADIVDLDALGGFPRCLPPRDLHRPAPQVGGHALGVVVKELRQRLDQRLFAGAAGGFHVRLAAVVRLRGAGVRQVAPETPARRGSIARNSCTAVLRSLGLGYPRMCLNHCVLHPCPTRNVVRTPSRSEYNIHHVDMASSDRVVQSTRNGSCGSEVGV